jgi:hypothetical protein
MQLGNTVSDILIIPHLQVSGFEHIVLEIATAYGH